jgi:hypothetical protein
MTAALIFLAVWAALIVFAFSLGRTAADADRRIERMNFSAVPPSPWRVRCVGCGTLYRGYCTNPGCSHCFPRPAHPPAGQSARAGDPDRDPAPAVHGSPAAAHGRRAR